jgi:hypothetical protein
MVYVIMSSDVSRNQSGRSWVSKAIIYTTSSLLAGAGMGSLLGAFGSWVDVETRLALATSFGLGAIVLGSVEIQRPVRLLQRDCEVSQRVMQRGALTGALRYGASLGLGATSRIGFGLWYAVPVGAFLSGHVAIGLGVYGMYALVRGIGPWMILLASRAAATQIPPRFEQVPLWLLGQSALARQIAAAQLLTLGICGVFTPAL